MTPLMKPSAEMGRGADRPADVPPALSAGGERLLLNRLSRLEGQVRGVRRLLDAGVPCDRLLMQVAALAQGTNAAAAAVLQAHMEDCLVEVRDAAGAARMLDDLERSMTQLLVLA